ncbi:MAG TPA: response regulator transcription factor [Myxococcota bacterium]|nr:response regulator transcription factor [Myxococcota bacterium]HRY92792.1 response regulator transcription factor [Myxococcota bacterium]HSA19832.1 response regulator transcription factor [Myxococcota bacterium]
MSKRILIVEDERDLVATLEYNLKREGFQTQAAANGAQAWAALERAPLPDLVLLDLMLPDVPGTEICRRIRGEERTRALPVIMVTAKGEEIDRVVGFELGADDYVSKPFSVRELLLRIRAVLRRAEPPGGQASAPAEVVFGVLRIDAPGHRLWVEGVPLKLTALEFRLLTTLLQRKGRAQSREVLLSDVWGIDGDVTTRTVDTHVKRLREKLGAAGDYIETLRGVGYRFRDRPEGDG